LHSYRIILADDHALFRKGVRKLIESSSDYEVIGEAESGIELLQLLEGPKPDLILLDLNMPNLGGIEVLPRIKASNPQAKVLVLTMHDDPEFLYSAIKAGADGFFLKKEADTQLFLAIAQVRKGEVYVSPQLPREHVSDWRQVRDGACESVLTEREREVMALVVEGKSNKQVAAMLGISVHTAARHRANIMLSLRVHSTVELVHYVLKNKRTL